TLQAGNVSLALAGGKGANLARLLGAGFSVPGGFIITTRAYHAYVAANNLENWIVEAARSARPDDPATLDEASSAIRARFDAGVVPPMLADAIGHAYAFIGCPRLRSALRPPPKICPKPRSPASRIPSSMLLATRRCSKPWCAAGAACGRRAPLAIACVTRLSIKARRLPSSCKRWLRARRPACSSPPTRSPASGQRRWSMQHWAWAKPWCQVRWNLITTLSI